MTDDELPNEVRQLIADHITSVEQLEILLLLREHEGEDWSVRRVSDELRSSEASVGERLNALRESGLVRESERHSDVAFGYAPRTARLRRATDLLADAYSQRRYTVIDLIFSKPIDKLRVYADAFRFRKDGSNG